MNRSVKTPFSEDLAPFTAHFQVRSLATLTTRHFHGGGVNRLIEQQLKDRDRDFNYSWDLQGDQDELSSQLIPETIDDIHI